MWRPLWLPTVVLLLATGASGAPIVYQASLDGPSEFPPVASPGTGSATITYDDAPHTLRVQATFSGLLGTTTASHIHCCVSPSAPTPTAGVATAVPTFPGFPLGVMSGTYDQTFDLTQAASWNPAFITSSGGTPAGAEATLAAALAAGEAYFNIHTSSFSGGEIRGFLVPEPATAALLAAGALLLFERRMRRRR